MQLRDATAKTVEESAKYMAAKEEIESLKSQVKLYFFSMFYEEKN